MKTARTLILHLPLLAPLLGLCALGTAQAAPTALASAQEKLASMSVPFVPNAGQWDKRAAFAAQTFAGTLFVTTEGQIVYSLPGKPIVDGPQDSTLSSSSLSKRHRSNAKRHLALDTEPGVERTPGWVLSETFVDTKGEPRAMRQSSLTAPAGYRPMQGNVSYVIGNQPSKHSYNLNTYERVNLGDMYPGVNVQLRATGNNVEKIFTVAPQQDPNQIQIKLAGANKLEIGTSGELIAHTENGPVTFTAPIAFQETASGERMSVQVTYTLDAAQSRYGFTLGSYDRSQPLVIDPLLQSTYLGGNWTDVAFALAIHPTTGEIYVAGDTQSTNFPGVEGGAQSVYSGSADAYVTRFNAALTMRLQSTYYGGTLGDGANSLAIHPTTGDVYIAGYTQSTDLPGTTSGVQTAYGGGEYDGFIARFNAALTLPLQASYIGGMLDDYPWALAIHPTTGNVYVAGQTSSADFPKVTGGAQSVNFPFGHHGFVTRFNAALTAQLQSTYHGGTGEDSVMSLAIHPATGDVYIAGVTSSSDLPGVAGGAQSAIAQTTTSFDDAFVTRLNASLTSVLQSTYLGGTKFDMARALAIHPTTGEVYVAGETESADFPGVAGGAQGTYGGGLNDAFITRFNPALTTRLQSSYLGGTGFDEAFALAIHPATGDVYVAGLTQSTDFPGVSGGAQSVFGGYPGDAFVTRLNTALTVQEQSSYVGGAAGDWAHALAIHPITGEVYVAGNTSSYDLRGVAGGAQSTFDGVTEDAFVTRISRDLAGTPVTPPVIPVIQPVPALSTYAMGMLVLLLLWITTPLGLQRQRFGVNCWGGER
jgi:hypothetical protein